jgi:hypothetical protein
MKCNVKPIVVVKPREKQNAIDTKKDGKQKIYQSCAEITGQ